jgi:hypothetical protein
MKAVRIRGYGNEPAIDDIAMPEPTEGECADAGPGGGAQSTLDIQLQAGYLSDWFPLAFPFTRNRLCRRGETHWLWRDRV